MVILLGLESVNTELEQQHTETEIFQMGQLKIRFLLLFFVEWGKVKNDKT